MNFTLLRNDVSMSVCIKTNNIRTKNKVRYRKTRHFAYTYATIVANMSTNWSDIIPNSKCFLVQTGFD